MFDANHTMRQPGNKNRVELKTGQILSRGYNEAPSPVLHKFNVITVSDN